MTIFRDLIRGFVDGHNSAVNAVWRWLGVQ